MFITALLFFDELKKKLKAIFLIMKDKNH